MKKTVRALLNNRIIKVAEGEASRYMGGSFIDCDYVVVTKNDEVRKIYDAYKSNNRKKYRVIEDFVVTSEEEVFNLENYNGETFLAVNEKGEIAGVVSTREIISFMNDYIKNLKNELDLVKTDLEAFMACSDDLACITDGSGSKVRISSSCEKIYGVKPASLIGKNVKDLEKNGMYFPSATRMVIEEKKPVTITQKTKTGRKLLVMATPVFDENGNIKRVVSISKDITDEEKLKAELNG